VRRPRRVVACLDRPPRRRTKVMLRAMEEAAAAGVPLHVIALARAVPPTCGCKFRGADAALEQAVVEQAAGHLRQALAQLPPDTTSELVRGPNLAALKARGREGDLLVSAGSRGGRPSLDYV
jgi:hypothetical protein